VKVILSSTAAQMKAKHMLLLGGQLDFPEAGVLVSCVVFFYIPNHTFHPTHDFPNYPICPGCKVFVGLKLCGLGTFLSISGFDWVQAGTWSQPETFPGLAEIIRLMRPL
jgi:hypothetical protein